MLLIYQYRLLKCFPVFIRGKYFVHSTASYVLFSIHLIYMLPVGLRTAGLYSTYTNQRGLLKSLNVKMQ